MQTRIGAPRRVRVGGRPAHEPTSSQSGSPLGECKCVQCRKAHDAAPVRDAQLRLGTFARSTPCPAPFRVPERRGRWAGTCAESSPLEASASSRRA